MSPDALKLLADHMDRLDDALYGAERAADVAEQIRLLRERAKAWREYGQQLAKDGRDDHVAVLAAMSDERKADRLEDGGPHQ